MKLGLGMRRNLYPTVGAEDRVRLKRGAAIRTIGLCRCQFQSSRVLEIQKDIARFLKATVNPFALSSRFSEKRLVDLDLVLSSLATATGVEER